MKSRTTVFAKLRGMKIFDCNMLQRCHITQCLIKI